VSLSTQELTQLRADQADYWPDTCTLQSVTRASDSQGGWTETWANAATSVSCRVMPQTSRQIETVEGEQVQAVTRWIMTVAYNQTIDETMRVVHGGETYEIEHLEDTHSYRTARRVYLRRLD